MPERLQKLESAPDLVEKVYHALLDAISEGSLPPGTRLNQEEVAQRLAVSRQPVVQAMRLLKKDRFLLDAPGRGVIVAPLDPGEIAQIYQVRSALDALAARLASQHRARIDPKILERGRKAAAGKSVRAMIEADTVFHNAVYAAARNNLLWQSAHVHWHHIRRAMGAALQASWLRDVAWDDHEHIADAIARGDADEAARLMSTHGAEASHYLTERLGQALQPLQG